MANNLKINPSHWTLFAALALACYACYGLIEPYISSIVLAFIVSLLFFPLHEKIEAQLPKSPNLSAILSCILLTVIIIIPLFFVLWSMLNQGLNFFNNAYTWFTDGSARAAFETPTAKNAIEFVNKVLPHVSVNQQEISAKIAEMISSFTASMLSFSSTIIGNLASLTINFFLMLFILFFFLRDHDSIINTIRHVLPLSRSQEDTLLNEVEQVAKSAVMGSFLTAVAQGVFGGFAMWLAGFAGLFWGTMMAFASFIPVVGPALIWAPAALYLGLTGQWEWAAFLCGWGIIVVGSVDNILRPFLMQGNSSMNTLMIFFSLLGGLHVYGLMGLIYGPIIFSLGIAIFNMYENEFSDFLNKQDSA